MSARPRMFAVRRDVLPIGNELRALAWAGVMLVAAGVAMIVEKRFEEIGPLTLALVLAAVALGCYAWAAVRPSGPLTEFVVLLGALLVSADLGFVEHRWHVLGVQWQRHFLLLAAVHAVAAYSFGSRAVLSLSVAALAAWFGIERQPKHGVDVAIAAFSCAGVVGAWRLVNRRRDFDDVLEHFGANLVFWGALGLAFAAGTRWLGVAIAIVLAAAAIAYGFRSRRELFVIYGYVYGTVAADVAMLHHLRDTAAVLYMLVSTIAVIAAMVVTHFRMRA